MNPQYDEILNKFCRLKREYKNKKDSIKADELCIIRKVSSEKVDVERVRRRKDRRVLRIKDIPLEDVWFMKDNITEDELLDTMQLCTLRYLFEHDQKNVQLKNLVNDYMREKRLERDM